MQTNSQALLVEARRKLQDSARRLREMRRHTPKAIVAQMRQGLVPDPQQLKWVSEYLRTLEAFEDTAEEAVGIKAGTS